MRTDELDFALPPELIAQVPVTPAGRIAVAALPARSTFHRASTSPICPRSSAPAIS